MRTVLLITTAALFAATALPAKAQSPDGHLTGWFELNSFHPSSTTEDGFSLERGRVLDHLQLGASAIFQFDNDPLAWQREDGDGYTQEHVEIERLLGFHLGAALGLFEYAQLGVQFPMYIDKGRPVGSTGAIGDLRVAPKFAYRFHPGDVELGLAAYVPIAFPTGDVESFTGQGSVSVEPRLAADLLVGSFSTILNLGALFKAADEDWGYRSGHEVFAGVGIGGKVPRENGRIDLLAEVTIATQTGDFMGRTATQAVLQGGALYVFSNGISLGGAMGTGLSAGVGVPDYRALICLGAVPRPFGEKDQPEDSEAPQGDDGDGDGIFDQEDQCPDEPEDFDGYQDQDGCEEPDNDNDGIADPQDRCPMAAENLNGVEDEDGCPEGDEDSDGIADGDDQCPSRPEDADGFQDNDGCPDLDNDYDDFLDEEDACPALPESAAPKKRDGCPDTLELEDDEIRLKQNISFKRRSPKITGRGMKVIDDLAGAVIANPQWQEIQILVHTYDHRTPEKNMALSERRAMAVLRALVEMGVAPERLVASGAGETVITDGGKAPRVEISIVKGVSK